MTPVLLPSSIPVAVGPNVQLPSSPVPSVAASTGSRSVSLIFARDKAIADVALLEAQQKSLLWLLLQLIFRLLLFSRLLDLLLKLPLPLWCLPLLWFNPPHLGTRFQERILLLLSLLKLLLLLLSILQSIILRMLNPPKDIKITQRSTSLGSQSQRKIIHLKILLLLPHLSLQALPLKLPRLMKPLPRYYVVDAVNILPNLLL